MLAIPNFPNKKYPEKAVPIFQSVRDHDITQLISQVQKRIVYLAPGVTPNVAEALIALMASGHNLEVQLVLDGDEECCRLGYCDAEALSSISAAAAKCNVVIRRHPGLRLGLMMADDVVLVWTPTPLMFEAPRTSTEPNGLILSPHTLKDLPAALGLKTEVDPTSSAKSNMEFDSAASASLPVVEVGTTTLTIADVEKVTQAIKIAPPAPFDLSRLSRVFSARFQFIETVLRGADLTKREMRLDNLILNSDAPEELRPLLHTTIQPFSTDADKVVEVPVIINGERAFNRQGEPLTKPTTQAEIRSYWTELCNRFLLNLPGFGKIIRHTDKSQFEAGKKDFEEVLEAWVDGFQELVRGDHEQRIQRVVDLIEMRMRGGQQAHRLERDVIEKLVRKGLENLRVIEPSIKVVYKNITVESTRDKEFLDALRKEVPAKELENWFQVFTAAPMVHTGLFS